MPKSNPTDTEQPRVTIAWRWVCVITFSVWFAGAIVRAF